MEGENSVLMDKVMPQLKQMADNLYCKINIVNLEVSLNRRSVLQTLDVSPNTP